MAAEFEKAVIAAGEKDYSSFKQNITLPAEEKIKSTLAGFIKYLEKNAFVKDIKSEKE